MDVTFGPFRLMVGERLLLRNGETVAIGARTLDLLIALTERPGQVLIRQDLMDRVWPTITVEESNLRVQIAGLRRLLGDGVDGARYITTIPGRGYCFATPVQCVEAGPTPAHKSSVPVQTDPLPPPLASMVGREDAIDEIASLLMAHRFVTILGPGGIGKTTVAIPVGRVLVASFAGAVKLVDLGLVSDPCLVASAVATTLGLLVQSSDPLSTLISYLRDRRMLLILDSCEHVIDAVAGVVETIHRSAPQVHILVTSREIMRAQGEFAYRLPPLATPPTGVSLTAAQAMSFAAIRLFVARVTATKHDFALTDVNAPVVAEICNKLDGMALAIELVAGRVDAFGVQQIAQLLEGQFTLLWHGRRTAPPRHQTLTATLDWSYDLLAPPEQVMLQRLSVFFGYFTLKAAEAVMFGPGGASVLDGLATLIDKSMVVADTRRHPALYRLLDTTRAYAGNKLGGSGQGSDVARRHAEFFAGFLSELNEKSGDLSSAQTFNLYAGHLGNVRSALQWSFGPDGDLGVGTALATGASRMFLQLSLLTECHFWSARAIAALDDTTLSTRRELELQASLAQSIMFSKGNGEEVRTALFRGLELAERLEERHLQLQLLSSLHIFHGRIGHFTTSMTFAQKSILVAEALGDAGGIAAAHSFLGISLHFAGNYGEAQEHLEIALSLDKAADAKHFRVDHRSRASIALARTLWLQGRCAEGVALAEHTERGAVRLEHPVTVCIVMILAMSIHLWSGDWTRASDGIRQFIEHVERHSMVPYYAVGSGFKGELMVRNGDAAIGVATLQTALAALHRDRYELMTTVFLCAIAEGQARLGQSDAALATIEGAIGGVEAMGNHFLLPELLRIKGELLAERSAVDAEIVLTRSWTIAQAQGAVSWQLRTAVSLARLFAVAGRGNEAKRLLNDALGRVAECTDTADMRTARRLFADLEK